MGGFRLTADSGSIDFKSEIKKIPRYFVRDGMVVETHKIIVYTFQMGDVDDPDLYAAEPLFKWQESEHGQWVMSNSSNTPEWHRIADPTNFGHKYYITAVFESKKLTEYYLRFGKIS